MAWAYPSAPEVGCAEKEAGRLDQVARPLPDGRAVSGSGDIPFRRPADVPPVHGNLRKPFASPARESLVPRERGKMGRPAADGAERSMVKGRFTTPSCPPGPSVSVISFFRTHPG